MIDGVGVALMAVLEVVVLIPAVGSYTRAGQFNETDATFYQAAG